MKIEKTKNKQNKNKQTKTKTKNNNNKQTKTNTQTNKQKHCLMKNVLEENVARVSLSSMNHYQCVHYLALPPRRPLDMIQNNIERVCNGVQR